MFLILEKCQTMESLLQFAILEKSKTNTVAFNKNRPGVFSICLACFMSLDGWSNKRQRNKSIWAIPAGDYTKAGCLSITNFLRKSNSNISRISNSFQTDI